MILAVVFFLALNLLFIKYFYWGPGGKAPTPEDEEKERAKPRPTARPKW